MKEAHFYVLSALDFFLHVFAPLTPRPPNPTSLFVQIAFWVVAVLGMLSLYFNIQHFKSSSPSDNSDNGNAATGNQHNNSSSSAGRIGNISVTKGSGGGGLKMAHISTGVEMAKVSSSSRRGSRSKGRRHKSSKHDGGGGYAKLSGDAGDEDFEVGDAGPFGGTSPSAAAALNGFYDEDSDQEEVDVSLVSLFSLRVTQSCFTCLLFFSLNALLLIAPVCHGES